MTGAASWHEGAAETSALDVVLAGFFSASALYPTMEVTAEMRSSALQALGWMGVDHLANQEFATLSTGEARRVAIARAIALGPRALVLDEPTAGLDVVASGILLDRVRSIANSAKTIIMTTHHLEEIVPEIGRVILLKKGSVFFDGPTNEALRSDRLSELFEAKVSVEHHDGRYAFKLWGG